MNQLRQVLTLERWQAVAGSLVILIVAAIGGVVLSWAVLGALRAWARRHGGWLSEEMIGHWRGPLRVLLPVIMVGFSLPFLDLLPVTKMVLQYILSILFILSTTWVAVATVYILRDLILRRQGIRPGEDLRSRRIYTQVRALERVLLVIIFVIAGSSLLMLFGSVRQMGISILASAGVIGAIVGFAGQRSIAMLFAGIQLAITRPILLGDSVVIENEFGQVEEITLTYVVVRCWDQRRLIVPASQFVEKTFQNWTRLSTELLGTVYLHTNYQVSVPELREQLRQILEQSRLWDRRMWGLQVTDMKEQAVELRALVSAANADALWNLRCEVREKLLHFLQRQANQ